MKLSIESTPVPATSGPRNGGRSSAPGHDSLQDRRFQDFLDGVPPANDITSQRTPSRGRSSATDEESSRDRRRDSAATSPPMSMPPTMPPPAVVTPGAERATAGAAGATGNEPAPEPTSGAAAVTTVTTGAAALAADETGGAPTTVPVTELAVEAAGVDVAAGLVDATAAATPSADAAALAADLVADLATAAPASTAPTAPTAPTDTVLASAEIVVPPTKPSVEPAADPLSAAPGDAAPGTPDAAQLAARAVASAAPAASPANMPAEVTNEMAGEAITSPDGGDGQPSEALITVDAAPATTLDPTSAPTSTASTPLTVSGGSGPAASVAAPVGTPSASTTVLIAPPAGPLHIDVDLGGEGLGPLRLRARAVAGELHMSLSAGDAHVRAALINHASGLRRDLELAGLDVASLDVGGSNDPQFDAEKDGQPSSQSGLQHQSLSDRSSRLGRGGTSSAPSQPDSAGLATAPRRPSASRLDLLL